MRATPGHRGVVSRVGRLVALTAVVLSCRGLEPQEPWVIAGHHEVTILPDGGLEPLILEPEAPLSACLQTAPTVDTSQWEASLRYSGSEGGEEVFRGPERRMGQTLCFAAPPAPAVGPPKLELCGTLRDGYTGRERPLACREVGRLDDSASYHALRAEMTALLREASQLDTGELVHALGALERRAAAMRFPFLAVRLRAVAAFFLRRSGGDEARREATRLVTDLPPWIERPEASVWAAQTALERASLAMVDGTALRQAWADVKRAERHYLRTASPKTISAVMKQAEILARVGALEEARRRLRTALAECQETPCHGPLLPHAQSTLAWWIAQDPAASAIELAEASTILDGALAAGTSEGEILELANLHVNRAIVDLRMGRLVGPALGEVRRLIGNQDGARARELLEWALLLEATQALRAQHPELALALARDVVAKTEAPRVAAWGWSLTGRSFRARGERMEAAAAFDRALGLHQHTSAATLGQEIPLGPSGRGEDYYRAARVAIERERPEDAWRILQRLDESTVENGATDCDDGHPVDSEHRQRLLRQLIALERPASAPRREQRRPLRRALLAELQELARSRGGCSPVAAAGPAPEPHYRAFALSDEVFLLVRHSGGVVALDRRTSLGVGELARILGVAGSAVIRSDEEWRLLVAPLARALAPTALGGLGAVTVFSLHGVLQGVPLMALPLPGDKGRDGGWLGDLTTAVVRAAGARVSAPEPLGKGAPVFIVDPSANLAGAQRSSRIYGELFPRSTVLLGGEATRERALSMMATAEWLHVGAHGRYDPAFPELSSLVLADGDLLAADLAARAGHLAMANLSACYSGSWPVTADSGRYGLAGLLSRTGVPWIVASRSELPDSLATEFNLGFYRELARGAAVPAAFGAQMRRLRRRFPASEWSAIFLVGWEATDLGGQTAVEVIPERTEPPAVPPSVGEGT